MGGREEQVDGGIHMDEREEERPRAKFVANVAGLGAEKVVVVVVVVAAALGER